VSGNVGGSQGHLLEGYSIPYRAVMTNLPLNTTVSLVLGYDIKNSGANALDYLTHYNRLLPHGVFNHPAEALDPRGGISALASATEELYAIPEPSSAGSPVTGQPGLSFNALPAAERKMSLYGATFFEPAGTGSAIAYVTQGNLTAAQAETTISITFRTGTSSTVVLAWGGHIARGDQWNGASASAISGSPYHMRTKSWNLNSLGNQDRSLSADAVVNPPKLIVIKSLVNDNGGNNVASDFQMNVRDANALPVGTPSDFAGELAPGTTVMFPDTATYTVFEDAFTGYATTYSADCFNGTTGTVKTDETKTCTVTNNDVAPTLALDKTVVGGSAVENDFVLSATPPTGTVITDAGGDVPATAARSNTVYTLSETTVTGYSAGAWNCTGTGIKNFDATAKTVELNEGAVVSCAITNTEVAPTLALDKTVANNGGGDAVENDFILSATPTAGATITDAGGDVPATTAQSNVVYTLSETTVTGYTAGTWNCTGTGIKAFDATAKTVSLNAGAVVSCAITNTDVAPTLALDKTVANNAGGNAAENDFVLSATPPIGTVITDAGGDVPATAARSNTVYTLSETTVTGYAAGTWNCTGTGIKAFDATAKTVSLDEGAVVSCAITNTDVAPTLALDKTVANNSGGDAVENDFILSATPTAGATITDAGGDVPATTAQANIVYTLSETSVTGYSEGTWNCTGSGIKAFSAANKTVSLDEGAVVSCAITNTDVAPTLALDKTVVNNAGGNAVENDFVLSATPTAGATITDAGGDVPATAAKSNLVYTLSETTVTGYTAGSWNCTGSGIKAFSAANKTVSLNEGAVVSCAITNTDVAPTLALDKTVVNNNGGGATENSFVLSATPTTGTTITDAGGDVPATAAKSNLVYTLSETTVAGYSAGDWSCTGSGIKNFDVAAKTIELNEGAVVVCAITNSDSKASPTGTTVQHWVLHDTMTIAGIRPGAPDAGTAGVTFRLYSDASCTQQVGDDETVAIVGGAAATVDGVTVTDVGEYRWRATYSGDSFNNGFTTPCGSEITQIYAKDDLMVGSPPAKRNNIHVPYAS
jgi:hypothetical protein